MLPIVSHLYFTRIILQNRKLDYKECFTSILLLYTFQVEFRNDCGEDEGGLRREYLEILIRQMLKSSYFEGCIVYSFKTNTLFKLYFMYLEIDECLEFFKHVHYLDSYTHNAIFCISRV